MYPRTITSNPSEPLSYPHYSDQKWSSPLTIFDTREDGMRGADKMSEGLHYNYDDRIRSREAQDAAEASGAKANTAAWWQAYLKAYHQVEAVDLRHIMAGSNWATGHPYYVFGYTYHARSETPGHGA